MSSEKGAKKAPLKPTVTRPKFSQSGPPPSPPPVKDKKTVQKAPNGSKENKLSQDDNINENGVVEFNSILNQISKTPDIEQENYFSGSTVQKIFQDKPTSKKVSPLSQKSGENRSLPPPPPTYKD